VYTTSFFFFYVAGFLMIVLGLSKVSLRGNFALNAMVGITLVSLALATVGLGFELWNGVRNLWGTTIGKIALGCFFALCTFVADLVGRLIIYKTTGENPDAFPSARTALIWISTPIAWILGLYVCGLGGICASAILAAFTFVWMLSRDAIQWFGKRAVNPHRLWTPSAESSEGGTGQSGVAYFWFRWGGILGRIMQLGA
jgi:hypothetical protein